MIRVVLVDDHPVIRAGLRALIEGQDDLVVVAEAEALERAVAVVTEQQPDLVLMMTGGLESAGGVSGLLDRLPALAETPAGQHRRFVTMEDSQILGFGPITGAVLDALAVATYAPEAVS